VTTVPKFEPNELVDIAIRAARIRSTDDAGWLYIGDNDEFVVDPAAPNVTVTRVAPKEWPPLAGDVWRDRDRVKWFAFRDPRGFVAMKPSCPTEDRAPSPEMVMAQLGPLTLHDRDGWTLQPVPAADESAEVDERAKYIARLEEAIEFLRTRHDVPLPQSVAVRMQYTSLGSDGNQEQRKALIRRISQSLGVEVAETTKDITGRYTLPSGADYVAYSFWPEPVEPVDQIAADAEQTVAAVVAEPEHGEVEQPNGRAGTAVPA
jgi:hypothetical protein